eukprot:6162552-Pleurochrysis_carterae.AAC.1
MMIDVYRIDRSCQFVCGSRKRNGAMLHESLTARKKSLQLGHAKSTRPYTWEIYNSFIKL